ncbi:type IV pilus biogenesis protein PilP [Paraburkholderia megapolitana]|uniref:type IV pilus biogenesis protein PilP n=1 Tax=Paraburkholderia megapolitana TaxID=420953 RepID=UPI0038B95432
MNIRHSSSQAFTRAPLFVGAVVAFALLLMFQPYAKAVPPAPSSARSAPAPVTRAGTTPLVVPVDAAQGDVADASQDRGIGKGGASEAVAQPLVANVKPATAGDSDALAAAQARIPLLKAEKDIAELEAAIDKLRHPDQGGAGRFIDAGGPLPPGGVPVASTPMPAVSDIVLAGAGSYDGRYTATLVIGGISREVQIGDVLDNGWKVARIAGDGVQLTRGARVRWVRF